mgnify:CR=1 FL=1
MVRAVLHRGPEAVREPDPGMKLAKIRCPVCGETLPFAIDYEPREDPEDGIEGVIATFWCPPCGQHRRGDWMIDSREGLREVPRIRRVEE